MTKKLILAKKCSNCNKIIRHYNKSGLCSGCYRQKKEKQQKKVKYTPLRRMCKKCEKMFTPEGKFCKICDNCRKSNGNTMNELIKTQSQVNHTLKHQKKHPNNKK